MLDFELMRKAMSGDAEAVREYCGSYTLVKKDGKFYRARLRGNPDPKGYTVITGVYDDAGYLLPRYWALPRIIEVIK